MSKKPIIFSGEMVKAILDGRKTQTRRVIKPQPEPCGEGGWMYGGDYQADADCMKDHLFHNVYGTDKCPYGGVYADGTADTLWVREAWAEAFNYTHDIECETPIYKADGVVLDLRHKQIKWKPSIHMPRWASRINLLVKDMRVERVQDITAEDVEAEGVVWERRHCCNNEDCGATMLERFACLWDSINSKRGFGWDVNPWVWVVEFEVK